MAATVKASKQPAKRPRRVQAVSGPPPIDVSGFEPPRLTTSSGPVQRVPLFYIDDTEYTVESRPGVNVGLKYLHLTRTQGQNVAISYLLEKLLGTEGYLALMEYDDLTTDQFEQICEIASQLTLGALEAPKA